MYTVASLQQSTRVHIVPAVTTAASMDGGSTIDLMFKCFFNNRVLHHEYMHILPAHVTQQVSLGKSPEAILDTRHVFQIIVILEIFLMVFFFAP